MSLLLSRRSTGDRCTNRDSERGSQRDSSRSDLRSCSGPVCGPECGPIGQPRPAEPVAAAGARPTVLWPRLRSRMRSTVNGSAHHHRPQYRLAYRLLCRWRACRCVGRAGPFPIRSSAPRGSGNRCCVGWSVGAVSAGVSVSVSARSWAAARDDVRLGHGAGQGSAAPAAITSRQSPADRGAEDGPADDGQTARQQAETAPKDCYVIAGAWARRKRRR